MTAAPTYTVVSQLSPQRAHIRFDGRFEGRRVVWDAKIIALRTPKAPRTAPYLEVGAAGANGRRLSVGLDVDALDAATLLKAVIMVRNYKRLRRGRVLFGERPRGRLERVVAGGQTGVDRAALDAAMAQGIDAGGYCPRGRRAEDGRIADAYPLTELPSPAYAARTRANVELADGTLILTVGPLTGGTALTARAARAADKPYCVIDLTQSNSARRAHEWLATCGIRVLNVAGPRESRLPGVYRLARRFLQRFFAIAAGRRRAPTIKSRRA